MACMRAVFDPTSSCGHAYAATASCMNSMLINAIRAAYQREDRVSLMIERQST
jgi:hypothetical protein